MNQNIIILKIGFEKKANTLFFKLFDEFRERTVCIDRRSCESFFQNLQGTYSIRLKSELEQLAMNFIEQERSLKDELNSLLSGSIRFYLHEFLLRSRSL